MYLIPSSFGKFLSHFQSKHTQPQLPIYNQSESTLFDHLPEDEKKAAISKLHNLAANQSGQPKRKDTSTVRCSRFNW